MTATDLQSRIAELEMELLTLKDKLEQAETIICMQRGLDEINHGLGRPAKQVVAALRAKFNLPQN